MKREAHYAIFDKYSKRPNILSIRGLSVFVSYLSHQQKISHFFSQMQRSSTVREQAFSIALALRQQANSQLIGQIAALREHFYPLKLREDICSAVFTGAVLYRQFSPVCTGVQACRCHPLLFMCFVETLAYQSNLVCPTGQSPLLVNNVPGQYQYCYQNQPDSCTTLYSGRNNYCQYATALGRSICCSNDYTANGKF